MALSTKISAIQLSHKSYSEKSWASTWPRVEIIILISSNTKPKVAMAHLVELMGWCRRWFRDRGRVVDWGVMSSQNSVFQDLKVQGSSAERNGALSDGLEVLHQMD